MISIGNAQNRDNEHMVPGPTPDNVPQAGQRFTLPVSVSVDYFVSLSGGNSWTRGSHSCNIRNYIILAITAGLDLSRLQQLEPSLD